MLVKRKFNKEKKRSKKFREHLHQSLTNSHPEKGYAKKGNLIFNQNGIASFVPSKWHTDDGNGMYEQHTSSTTAIPANSTVGIDNESISLMPEPDPIFEEEYFEEEEDDEEF